MKQLENAGCSQSTKGLPLPFRQPSGRQLLGPVPQHFEQFYRSRLRYCSGARVRTMQIANLYATWASSNGAPSLNARQLKRAMMNIGHPHLKSNGMWFGDVRLAADAPHESDNFPEGPPPGPARLGLVGRIDRISLELEQLRREVAASHAK